MAKFFGLGRKLAVADRAARSGSGVFASAPLLPPRQGNPDTQYIGAIPPFGTNMPISRPVAPNLATMDERSITNDPRELWYLALPNKLTPQQVLTILRSGLGGDIWQVWQLVSLMLDTWPMLRKCSHEVREAVSSSKFLVRPHCEEGAEATAPAKERADLVRRAMKAFKPDPFSDERGFEGMVYDITDAMLNGLTMTEVVWQQVKRAGASGQFEWLPRASAWVHPRHFTFTDNGRIAVFDKSYNKMYFPQMDKANSYGPDLRRFIVGQFPSRSGSSLVGGLARPLAPWWSAVVFCREWMLTTAQKHGSPFRTATYKPGMSKPEKDELMAMLRTMGEKGYGIFLEGTVVDVTAPARTGTDNPQRFLMEHADKECQQLILGQNLSSDSPRNGGSRSQGDNHMEVRRDRIEGVARWVANEPLRQFARAVLLMNYGTDDECPEVVADFTEATDPLAQAQRDAIMLTAGVPMLYEDFCKANNMSMPEPGDLIIKGGTVGIMAEPQQDVGAAAVPEPTLDADGNPVPPAMAEGGEKVVARGKGRDLQGIIARAKREDVEKLKELVLRASAAKHVNGEFADVEKHLRHMAVNQKERLQGV